MSWPTVLDACVLVPGGLRDDLLSIAAVDLYLPVWSLEILDEVARTLDGPRFGLAPDRVAHIVGEMRSAFPRSEVAGWASRLAAVPDAVHPDDRHVVAVALASEARSIVTANYRDFAADVLAATLGIEVKAPDDFLVDQWTMDPRRAVVGVQLQIGRLGRAPAEHVAAVAKRLPRYGEVLARDIALIAEPEGGDA